MKIKKFNSDWYFWYEKDSFALLQHIPENAQKVELPHDAMMCGHAFSDSQNGAGTGYRDGDIYVYAKKIYVPEELKERTVMLKFEGVYMNAFVSVNGQLAAKNPFGYTTFYADICPYLKYGADNEIRVQVRTGTMNSRWYSGGGIYRDVYWLESDRVYIQPDSCYIRTEELDEEYAVVAAELTMTSRCPYKKELLVETVLYDWKGEIAAQESTVFVLQEGKERNVSNRIVVEHPQIWSAENPNMYGSVFRVYDRETGEVLDEHHEKVGIRKLSLDAKRGLRMNGSVVKLRGACIHHDSGMLGSATYERAQYRQIQKLKDAGFNAVRMSHQPMSQAMLRACDEIGMYVMDETFDMWTRCKSGYDYSMHFTEWWESDVEAMVKKDRCHPSVVLYSIGNEIPEIAEDQGTQICYEICRKIKSMDTERFTLASINGIFMSSPYLYQIIEEIRMKETGDRGGDTNIIGNVNEFMAMQEMYTDDIVRHEIVSTCLDRACAPLDIAGYNYMTSRYEKDVQERPNRVIVGSETYPPDIARNWQFVEKYPQIIGDFTWTGWDYLGEAGIGIPGYKEGEGGFGAHFPAQLAYCGDFDINGERRPMSYYREIVFGRRQDPYIAVQNPARYGEEILKTPWCYSDACNSWSWDGYEGKPVIVEVYSAGEEVALELQGKEIGRKKSGIEAEFRVDFEVDYEPGILEAVTYECGKEIGRFTLSSEGKAVQIAVEEEQIWSEKGELRYFNISLQDANGKIVTNQDQRLSLETDSGIEFLRFGTGNPKPDYDYSERQTKTFMGKAMLILKEEARGQVKIVSQDMRLENKIDL